MRDVPNAESAGYDLIPPLAEMVVLSLENGCTEFEHGRGG